MKTASKRIVACFLIAGVTKCAAWASDPIDFAPRPGFAKLPDEITLGACSGVAVNSKGEVYLFHRGKHPIIRLGADGKFVDSWGDDLIGSAHGLRIDRDDNVWVTDIGKHQVMKFTAGGKLLMTLGKPGDPGKGTDQFDKPTDIAFGRADELYVADGYGNSRVMKFTVEGKYVTHWGEPGTGPSQFDTPHTLVVDRAGRVIVGDRENNRVQMFDGDGKLLRIWTGFAPFGMVLDTVGNLFVADGRANMVLQLDGNGKIVGSWGGKGSGPGLFRLPHMLSTDRRGNLYVVEITGKRLQKLARK